MTDRVADSSPRLKARVAGIFYAITVVTGAYALFAGHGNPLGRVANLIAGAAYIVVTVLLYDLLRPVNGTLAMVAAFFSLVGVASGNDGFFFFWLYCISLGILIFRSSFFPRIIGVLMAIAGLALLTNTVATLLSPALAHSLSFVTGGLDGLGEISLTLWLIVGGVNVTRWQEQAEAARTRRSSP